ncbi:MAG: alpha/beta hydrolase [Nocardioides sp.]
MPSPLVTSVGNRALSFRLADPDAAHEAVSLWCDLELGDTRFGPVPGGWARDLPVGGAAGPAIDRIEYLFDVDGTLGLDPGNPLVVPGAFGDHSWLPLEGYAAPAWLDIEPVAGERAPATLEDTPVGTVDLEVWAPADATVGESLPLLISHDGLEMDEYGALTRFVGAGIAAGRLPRMRVALLVPGARNERYAANPAYAATLVDHVVPLLAESCPSPVAPVLMGQSLGAVAALHAAWTSPGVFSGLFLESGSFFTPELDPQEAEFEHWSEVTGFVDTVLAAEQAAPCVPAIAIGCGSAEENLANNRLLADGLSRIGADVTWSEVRDGHTWTCWRDLLDPGLTDLLGKVWV